MTAPMKTMPVEVALRPYQSSDLRAIVHLDRHCFSEPFRFSMRAMRQFVQAADALSMVANETGSGRVVGFIIVHLSLTSEKKHAYVLTLDVHPTCGGCGIGSRLLAAMERGSIRVGATRMDLHVYTENKGAIAFYRARGFQEEIRLKDFYGPGRDAFACSKKLGVAPEKAETSSG